MSLDFLRLMRNILLRAALIGIGLTAVIFLAVVFLWNTWTTLTIGWFHTDEAHLSSLALGLLTQIRFYIVFVLLVPGLAIHWTLLSEQRRT